MVRNGFGPPGIQLCEKENPPERMMCQRDRKHGQLTYYVILLGSYIQEEAACVNNVIRDITGVIRFCLKPRDVLN